MVCNPFLHFRTVLCGILCSIVLGIHSNLNFICHVIRYHEIFLSPPYFSRNAWFLMLFLPGGGVGGSEINNLNSICFGYLNIPHQYFFWHFSLIYLILSHLLLISMCYALIRFWYSTFYPMCFIYTDKHITHSCLHLLDTPRIF